MFQYFKQLLKKIPGVENIYLQFRYRRYLKVLQRQKPEGNGIRILIINHHFDQDIQAFIKGSGDRCSFFVIDCMPFFNQALLFFRTDKERDGIIPYTRLPSKITQGYRKVAQRLFADLYAIFPFQAIVMPSDSFWWVREFLEVAVVNGIPRIVVDKEGIISPYYYEMHSRQIKERYPFISDYLLVWSERQKNYWLKAGAPAECIKVLGQPRSDFFFKKERWLSREKLGLDEERRVLLFFTFDVDAYIHIFPSEEIRRESLSWQPLRNEINTVLIEFAKRHGDVDVVIKVHPQQSDIEHVRAFFDIGLPNIKIMEGAFVSNHLLVNADLVVGFQTTALIEAMLTSKPVIYAAWGNTEQKLRDHLIPFHLCRGLQKADSKEMFDHILESWSRGACVGGDIDQRKDFTDQYLNADGHVCERLSEALIQIVSEVH